MGAARLEAHTALNRALNQSPKWLFLFQASRVNERDHSANLEHEAGTEYIRLVFGCDRERKVGSIWLIGGHEVATISRNLASADSDGY